MAQHLSVGVLGATGLAGQQVLVALARHPWFRVAAVAASEASTGKELGEALRDQSGASRWFADGEADPGVLALRCVEPARLVHDGLDLVFSAVGKAAALEWEPRLAERMPVISTASAFRQGPGLPL